MKTIPINISFSERHTIQFDPEGIVRDAYSCGCADTLTDADIKQFLLDRLVEELRDSVPTFWHDGSGAVIKAVRAELKRRDKAGL